MNFKKIIVLTISILIFNIQILCQNFNKENIDSSIKYEAVVSDISYCGLINAKINLKLRIINQGKQDLVIFKEPFVPYRHTVNENNLGDAGRLIRGTSYMLTFTPYFGKYSDDIDTETFYILKPKEKLEITNYYVSDFIENNRVKDGLKNGKYFLNLYMRAIPFNPSVAYSLQQKWKSKGKILFEDIIFSNIELNILANNTDIKKECSEFIAPSLKISQLK